MPTPTFDHLAPEKKDRITAALLTEFSQYGLADAQVARIVTAAGIARGAFYKYFADLTDAYQYLYGVALSEIHQAIPSEARNGDLMTDYQAVVQFVDQVSNSRYYRLIQRHFTQNESLVPAPPLAPATMPATAWAAMVLSHATIKEILLAPDQQAAALQRLRTALAALAS
ncbi:transcriptional regulator [Levilactobacillus zymae]|uniref:Transcriptional regulator n=1 Tax=Levilactobacillus zymae TaxID=267363 RepID=A0ABQ0WYV2_9LACO|nr:TetR family transcriptional regulator [Levilactobacillus zymae]KRL16340.1 transcriptional regulator [Levilactobacillus zymae DSM 19395]QFR61932.1 TetR family transcriptional regulator [Levilactobacillus zymae]GEO72617.1 transcriptional regulator [Levilactobacillus zymae]